MGNLSVLIAHRQVVPSSAELIAGLAGTRGAWQVPRQEQRAHLPHETPRRHSGSGTDRRPHKVGPR